MSMVVRRLGLSVLLVERGSHPRFAIGESTSPLTNLLLEEIATQYDLPFLLPLSTYGQWQRTYPEIAVGLKRGFTYYRHEAGNSFVGDEDRSTQLMVAASPSNEVSDTHWYRADLDSFFVNQAVDLGVEYIDLAEITNATTAGSEWKITGSRLDGEFEARARLLIDATGPRGVLHRLFRLPEAELPGFAPTQALYSHFSDVERCDELEAFRVSGTPPFAPDDAALHHVFDGGWMWVLRFGNGITSAGFSVTDNLAGELGLPGDVEAAWQRFLDRFPSIGKQFQDSKPTRPFIYAPRLSFRTSRASGAGWAMLPSAAGFIDPLFSTGIPLTLLGIERLGKVLGETWGARALGNQLLEYGEVTLEELDSTAEFVGASLHSLTSFPVFAAFSMFYFAAASYSEMARRLDKRRLVKRFLAADREDFRSGMYACIGAMPTVIADPSQKRVQEYVSLVARSIECLNVAGLADTDKHNWYGVDLQDVVRNAHKLEMTPEAVSRIIATADWAQF